MKLNLQTRLFPNYNPITSLAANKEKKEEEARKEAEQKAAEQVYEDLAKIKTFTIGTTPNFTIDLNPDMLRLEDIEQLTVVFGQFGKMVQKEILYFSDNYKLDYELVEDDGDYEYDYKPLSAELVTDEKDIFNDNIQFKPTRFYEDQAGYIFNQEPCTYKDPYDLKDKKAIQFFREIEKKYTDSEGVEHIRLVKEYKRTTEPDAEDKYHNWMKDDSGFFVVEAAKDEEGDIIHIKKYEDDILFQRHRWAHPHQTIRNPKFTYDKIFNKLVLTLSQRDTFEHFKPTNWRYNKEDPSEDLATPYWQGNPSLVMIEVKIRVKRHLDQHFGGQVIIKPQEYYAVAETIEYRLKRPMEPVRYNIHDRAADEIYVIPRFKMYFGDFSEPEYLKPLPDRVEALPYSKLTTMQNLLRDGFRAISRPQYLLDSEGNKVLDPFGFPEQVARYFCIMIPLHIKLKIKSIKLMFGGSPGVSDNVDYDATGLHFYDSESTLADSEGKVYWEQIKDIVDVNGTHYLGLGRQWYDERNIPTDPLTVPRPGYYRGESCTFHSDYVIDPDGVTPENPMGEYICWYVCSKESVTGNHSRFYGPGKYREDQRHEPYYEFFIQFEEIGKATRFE